MVLGKMVSRIVGRVVGLEATGAVVTNAYKFPPGCIAAGCPNMRKLTVAVADTMALPVVAEIGAAMPIVAIVAAAKKRADGVAAAGAAAGVAGSVTNANGCAGGADPVVGVAAAVGAD